jgi:hypothetical protein
MNTRENYSTVDVNPIIVQSPSQKLFILNHGQPAVSPLHEVETITLDK